MKWSYSHPPTMPIRILVDESDPIKHIARNGYRCLDITCPCSYIPGRIARREIAVERKRGNALMHDEVTQQLPPPPPGLEFWNISVDDTPTPGTHRIPSGGQRRRVTLWHRLKGLFTYETLRGVSAARRVGWPIVFALAVLLVLVVTLLTIIATSIAYYR